MSTTHSLDVRIRGLFGRLFQIAPDAITDSLRRGTHERWDSLGHLELLEALRNEFAIEIPPDDALAMETFADVRRVVGSLCSASASPAAASRGMAGSGPSPSQGR